MPFTLIYWKDENWFVGQLKEVPSVFSQGETLNELKQNILEVYHLLFDEIAVQNIPNSNEMAVVI